MLVVETVARIRREHFIKGKTIKEIARDLKVSRNTVRCGTKCCCRMEYFSQMGFGLARKYRTLQWCDGEKRAYRSYPPLHALSDLKFAKL
jgi:hypothetical protein